MAGLIRSLFKGKKTRKENKDETGNVEDYLVFQPCSRSSSFKRQPTARFADDCMLPATAAYHTKSAPKLRKGPQSCPGGNLDDDFPKRKSRGHHDDFQIDEYPEGRRHHQSHRELTRHHSMRQSESKKRNSVYDFRSDERSDDDQDNDENLPRFDKKPQYYMHKYENSERQRREDRRKQEKLEEDQKSIQSAMTNMAFCMASVQQMEQLKKERDQYKKEANRYKNRCEKLENKFEQMETMSPNFGGLQTLANTIQPSPYQTPQFPPALSFKYPMPSSSIRTFPQPPYMMNPTMPMSARSMEYLNHNGRQPHLPPPLSNFQQNFLTGNQMNNTHGGSTSFSSNNTPTTISSEGAGESLVNRSELSFLGDFKFRTPQGFDDDVDDIKNFREEFLRSSRMSDITQSTATTN